MPAVGQERLAQALEALVAALPSVTKVDGQQVIQVADPECRRLLEGVDARLEGIEAAILERYGVSNAA